MQGFIYVVMELLASKMTVLSEVGKQISCDYILITNLMH